MGIDLWTHNPWRAPGTAPIFSPCGNDGGNPHGCPVGNASPEGCAGGGYGLGPDALHTDFPGVMTTEWAAGSVVEAFWGITANHGGGYQYRLAKLPAEGKGALTEEMFQQMPLMFHGDDQYVQFGPDLSKRVHFKAVQTNEGTWPAGSTWRRNPIPACKGPGGGSGYPPNPCNFKDTNPPDELFQFPPPAKSLIPGETLGGFGNYNGDGGSHPGGTMNWSVVDQLQVPSIEPGEYVLSVRFDCEQTSQVWNTCANIRITAPGDALLTV